MGAGEESSTFMKIWGGAKVDLKLFIWKIIQ